MKLKSNLKRKFSKKELNDLSKKINIGKHKTFHTHDFLGYNMAQLYFIHNNQIFNCSIMSLKGDYMSNISDKVYEKVKEIYPKYYEFDFVPLPNKPGYSEMVHKHKYDEKEVKHFQEELYKTICESKEIEVRERIEIDMSYEYGIGVNVYLDVEKITKPICNKIIKLISDLGVIYEGSYFLGENKSFTYKESKDHTMMGAAMDLDGEENADFRARIGIDDLEDEQ